MAKRRTAEKKNSQQVSPRSVEGAHREDFRRQPQNDQRWVKNLVPKTEQQKNLMNSIDDNAVTFAIGPAGCGKTFIAVSKALESLEKSNIKRIIFIRPAVTAGENLGFLPGDLQEKIHPYMAPIYDILIDRIGQKKIETMMADKSMEACALGMMRGRTLMNAFIVLDEAQNATYGQIKMAITRLGHGSKMVITGDPLQTDLVPPEDSGLLPIAQRLSGIPNVSVCRLGSESVVRCKVVKDIIDTLES